MKMSKNCAFLTLLLACNVVLTAGLAARPQAGEVDWSLFFPDGEGKMETQIYCGGRCHSLSVLVKARKGEDAWRNAAEGMLQESGEDAMQDVPLIVSYLASHFGLNTAELHIPLPINSASVQEIAVFFAVPSDVAEKIKAVRDAGVFKDFEDFQERVTFSGKELETYRQMLDFKLEG